MISPKMRRLLGDVRSILTATNSHESISSVLLPRTSCCSSTASVPPNHHTLRAVGLELELDVRAGATSYRVESLHYDRGRLKPGEALEVRQPFQRVAKAVELARVINELGHGAMAMSNQLEIDARPH